MVHYLIIEAEPPTGMQTAACRVCIACGQGLTTGGGPGDYICRECLEALRRGPWRGNLRRLRDAPKADLIPITELL